MSASLENFAKNLPKVELHAHINGSLSRETLLALVELKHGKNSGVEAEKYQLSEKYGVLTLDECFVKFRYAHELTDTPEAISLATQRVIQEFSDDNVVYLELRTTPRATAAMTKAEYLNAVIDAIRKSSVTNPKIIVKLLVSINRKEGRLAAEENLALLLKCAQTHSDIIKGMDLSGDPKFSTFQEYKDLLEQARQSGLKLALHCGEIDNEEEISEMLTFGMSRLGHGTCINGKNEETLLTDGSIVLECCLTSNVLCGSVTTFEDHHFKKFYESGHSVVICTDDCGVFNTTLSKELAIASQTFNLSKDDLIKLSQTAIKHSFASDEEKQIVLEQIESFQNSHKDV